MENVHVWFMISGFFRACLATVYSQIQMCIRNVVLAAAKLCLCYDYDGLRELMSHSLSASSKREMRTLSAVSWHELGSVNRGPR